MLPRTTTIVFVIVLIAQVLSAPPGEVGSGDSEQDDQEQGDSQVSVDASGSGSRSLVEIYNLPALLGTIEDNLGSLKDNINLSVEYIIDMATTPQEALAGMAEKALIELEKIMGNTLRLIRKYLMKGQHCLGTNAGDLPKKVTKGIAKCVTNKSDELIDMFRSLLGEIASALKVLRGIVNSVTGCSGMHCMDDLPKGFYRAFSVARKLVWTIFHFLWFGLTTEESLPACIIGQLSLSPAMDMGNAAVKFATCMANPVAPREAQIQ